jgi:hypothetical protein
VGGGWEESLVVVGGAGGLSARMDSDGNNLDDTDVVLEVELLLGVDNTEFESYGDDDNVVVDDDDDDDDNVFVGVEEIGPLDGVVVVGLRVTNVLCC